jgi:hypothetical protein
MAVGWIFLFHRCDRMVSEDRNAAVVISVKARGGCRLIRCMLMFWWRLLAGGSAGLD